MFASRPGPSIATHHLDLSELSIDQALLLLHRSETDPYHAVRVFKLSLLAAGDEVMELLSWLNDDKRKIIHAPWVRRELELRVGGDDCTSPDMAERGKDSTAPSLQKSRIPLRVITVSNHKLTQRGYDGFAQLISMHGSLTALDLTLNTLSHQPLPSLRTLSKAVSQSLLRKLVLSDTRLSIDAFCELLDHLDAPCLHELRLSLTLSQRGIITKEESHRAALSVARLLRVKGKRVGNENGSAEEGGRAPHLEVLTLNGNHLTLPGVKMVVAAALGGPSSPPNRVLTHVELFATCDSDERDEEDDDTTRGGGGGSGAPRRTLSIIRGYRAARERQPRHELSSAQTSSSPTAGDLFHSSGPSSNSVNSSSSSRSSSEVWSRSTQYDSSRTSSVQQWYEYEPDDPRAYAHITAENWRRLLGSHLWQNTRQRSSVVYAAQLLIGKARILGCKSQSAPPSPDGGIPPLSLERLPPELRLAILRQLDPDKALSEDQFRLVISWACDATTIGYGNGSEFTSQPWLPHSPEDEKEEKIGGNGLLPTTPWSWKEMLTRSLPRDWISESWDQWNEHKDTIPIIGGGGGPDGEGGAMMEGFPSSFAFPSLSGRLNQRGRGWRSNTLDRRAPDPARLAFLEATGTRYRQG